jgi:hypothetical protein
MAFSPAHMIPGIEPSPDKMLQVKKKSYDYDSISLLIALVISNSFLQNLVVRIPSSAHVYCASLGELVC